MGIVQVRPDEEPRVGDAVQPPHRIRDDRVGPPLTRAAVDGTRFGTARSRAGVFVESSIQTASRRQHDRSNEGGGPEAPRLQRFCERRVAGRHRVVRVVTDTVPRREETREEARVRRQRQRRDGRRPVEYDALPREPIERRHRHVHESVRRQPIGARRIERDNDDVEVRDHWRGRRPPESGDDHARRQQPRPRSRPADRCRPLRHGGHALTHFENVTR